MHLSTILLAGIGLGASTHAYVVTLYSKTGCTGDSKEVNVWDNTCAQPSFDTMSLRVDVYGGSEQRADIYTGSGCWPHERLGTWDADKGNLNSDLGTWSQGQCVDFSEKVYSFGSRWDPWKWGKRSELEGRVGHHFVA
jgi:hypothetical protein